MCRRAFGLLLLILLLANAVTAGERWRVTRTSHFIIYYADQSAQVAAKTAKSAEIWYSRLSEKLGFSPGGVTPVYLYPDRGAFSEATGVGRADTIVGLAQAHIIRIDASGVYSDVEQILAHEMVHVFVVRRLHGYTSRLPLWLHEGLAQYLANDWTDADQQALEDAVAGGTLLSLPSITTSFPRDQMGREIAYAESYSIVEYIARRYTLAALRDLITETKHGRPFDIACLYSLGTAPGDLETEWRASVMQQYGMQRWFRLGTAIISAFMAVFVILAFSVRIHQKRRKARQFEEERQSRWHDVDMGDQ